MVKVGVDLKSFNKAFVEYMKVTSKTLTEAVNYKAGVIAVKSLSFTKKATRGAIEQGVGQIERVAYTTRTGRQRTKAGKLTLNEGRNAQGKAAPLAALIVNKRKGEAGEAGLTGAKMEKAIRKLINKRISGIGFLASGWLPAIQAIKKVIRGSLGFYDRKVREYGKRKGSAKVARDNTWTPSAVITNELANPEVQHFLDAGAQAAIDAETASMNVYLEGKLKPAQDRFNSSH